jgi:hypothetical protein
MTVVRVQTGTWQLAAASLVPAESLSTPAP